MNLACFTSFQPEPVTIDSLAYSEELNIVVEGLADGSIRFLDPASLALLGSISGSPMRSVRRMLFYRKFLISCGVHGSVHMWDTETLDEVSSVESSQGAVWDMAMKGDKLYLATETGSVVVVELSEGQMRVSGFLRSGSKSNTTSVARALSVCIEGEYLFVGTANGTVSRWNIPTGSCDSTFSIPSKNDIPILIWSLLACGNGLLVSGDSTGTVSLWDSKSCTLVQSRQDHQGDVLVMHMTRNNDLFTSGVDARVARYKISGDRLNFVSISALLSRDISALVTCDKKLLMGGSDARIGVVSIEIPRTFASARLDRFREQVEVRSNMVFVRDGWSKVRAFKVSSTEEEGRTELVAEFDNKTPLACFGISEDARQIVLVGAGAAEDKIFARVLSLGEDGIISPKFTDTVSGTATACATSERFSVLAFPRGQIRVVDHSGPEKSRIISLGTGKGFVTKLLLRTASCSVIVARGQELFSVSLLDDAKVNSIHKFDALITAVSQIDNASCLIVSTADHHIHRLNLHEPKTEWKRKISHKMKIPAYNHVNHIVRDTSGEICLFGESFILTRSEHAAEEEDFKFNSSVPTGGVVIGAGRWESACTSQQSMRKKPKTDCDDNTINGSEIRTLAVLANYKATNKALISPFERKCFQH